MWQYSDTNNTIDLICTQIKKQFPWLTLTLPTPPVCSSALKLPGEVLVVVRLLSMLMLLETLDDSGLAVFLSMLSELRRRLACLVPG